jgi:hypothetical protein
MRLFYAKALSRRILGALLQKSGDDKLKRYFG